MLFLTRAKVDSPAFSIHCLYIVLDFFMNYEDFHVLVHHDCVPDLVVHPESAYGPPCSKATFSSVDRESSSHTLPVNHFAGSILCDPTNSGWNLDLGLILLR